MEKDKKYPGIRQSILLLVIGIVLMFLTNILAGGIMGGFIGVRLANSGMEAEEISKVAKETVNNNLGYLASVGIIISSIVLIFIALKKRNLKLKELVFRNKERVNLKLFGIIAIISIGLVSFSGEAMGIAMSLLKIPPSSFEGLNNIMKGIPGIVIGLILAPVFEEIIFRGIILEGISSRHSKKIALISSALLFSVYHLTLVQLVPAFLAGLLLGYIYLKTRSVLICIYTHFVYNIIPVLLTQLQNNENLNEVQTIESVDYLIITGASVVLIMGLILLRKYFNQFKKQEGVESISM